MRCKALLGITFLLFISSCRGIALEIRRRVKTSGKTYANLERGWSRQYSVTEQDLRDMKKEVEKHFDETFQNYMVYAFPKDDLLPISCKGHNSEGGMALTLIDSLDTLIVMNRSDELRLAIHKIEEHVTFDIDHLAHVFELNIRAVGGMLSAHMLLKRNPDLLSNYTDSLLHLSLDLATRLLPAFDTVTGIPRSRVNLKTGAINDSKGRPLSDGDITCCACAGTLLLEMGILSRLTGQSIFEEKAKKALQALFNLRSILGLLGNTVHIQKPRWITPDSSIGAGSDSIHEYLLKAYVLFGDVEYLEMFTELYSAVMQHQKTPKLAGGYRWLADVHVSEGYVIQPWISSLSAFWPAMQALAGQNEEAIELHKNFTTVWLKFAALPERFSLDGKKIHPKQSGYPLRPEFIESTYVLYSTTKDPYYLKLGRVLQKSLLATRTSGCGFASIKDVSTGELSDAMESFFLSESLKYLYLLHSNITTLINAFVFTTEAHIFPPVHITKPQFMSPFQLIPCECEELCKIPPIEEIDKIMAEITEKFPLLKPKVADFELIQKRRCSACVRITSHIKHLPKRTFNEMVQQMDLQWALVDDSDHNVAVDQVPVEALTLPWNLPYEFFAAVRCIISTSRTIKNSLHCIKVDPLPPKALSIRMGLQKFEEAVVVRKTVPHEWNRRGHLVLKYPMNHKEFTGVFHQYVGMKPADEPISLACPATVLKAMSQEEGMDIPEKTLTACGEQLIFGAAIVADPISACGRIYNTFQMRGAIVVISQTKCKIIHKLKTLRSAGAVGIIMIKKSEEDNEWMYDLLHYTGGLPVFMIPPSEGERLVGILNSHPEVYAMMGMSVSTLLKCPLPDYSFPLPQVDPAHTKTEVILPKETRAYFARTISQGSLDKANVHYFLQTLSYNREIRRVFRKITKLENQTD